jgi:adenylate cyclase
VFLFGDPRRCSLEQRLFNTISLLSAVANLGGAIRFLDVTHQLFLLLLHLGSGVLLLAFYYGSRWRDSYRSLYWPLVLLLAVFLLANSLDNAGSSGGAHYYLIPALVIAVILSGKGGHTALAVLLFATTTVTLLLVEQLRPDWVTPHATRDDRFGDVLLNLVFAQVFTGVLVIVLARNLNQERRKSDRLLLNILPEGVAEQLKRTDRVEPLQYDASVLFTDFVGFTHISEGMTPHQLIAELDACFRRFDQIARKHRLEKIKTIGDSYMAVAGLPVPSGTHAVDCVRAALEIRNAMAEIAKQKAREGKPCWQVRIGVHSGPLIAGVIGREKFAYDVWGDTVNLASRMESSGAPGCINISAETYERVKDFFDCEYRGKIVAKNKGELDMYFVLGLRRELTPAVSGQPCRRHQ